MGENEGVKILVSTTIYLHTLTLLSLNKLHCSPQQ